MIDRRDTRLADALKKPDAIDGQKKGGLDARAGSFGPRFERTHEQVLRAFSAAQELPINSVIGAANRTRTCDPVITNDVLYQLSYCGGPSGASATA